MITYDAATIYITSYYLYPIYNRIPSLQVIKKSKKKKSLFSYLPTLCYKYNIHNNLQNNKQQTTNNKQQTTVSGYELIYLTCNRN